MSSKLNRHAYEKLIAEDIEWLLKQPRTLEREHIEAVLRCSPDREYARSERTSTRDAIIEECADAIEGSLKERMPSGFYASVLREMKGKK